MIINGLRIPLPHTFKTRERERPRVSVAPSAFRLKATVTIAPSNPRALHAMPVFAIVAAIGSIVGGVAAAGAATSILGTVLAGAMIVGGAATLIGAATGNQNLMKYGSILSLVGGVGTAAVGMFGEAATAGADTAASMSGPTTTGYQGDGVTNVAGATDPAALTPPPSSGVLNAAPDAAELAAPIGGGSAQASVPTPTPSASPLSASPADLTSGSTMTTAAPVTPDSAQIGSTSAFQTPPPPTPALPGATVAPPVADPSVPNTGFFNSVGQWVKNNPDLAKIGATAATGLFGSLVTSPAQQAQIDYSNTVAAATKAKSARDAQRADWGRGISKPITAYGG